MSNSNAVPFYRQKLNSRSNSGVPTLSLEAPKVLAMASLRLYNQHTPESHGWLTRPSSAF